MGYELDFLPVGDGERSGDAIALRFGDLGGSRENQIVAVVDGGFTDTGKQLAEHVRRYYGTERVELVVSTHPDADHAAGLQIVLEEMTVGGLLMHRPWEHTDDIAQMFRDGRVTDASVGERLRRSLESARNLETLAKRKGIPIIEPFAGVGGWDGMFRVIGPTEPYYESLLPEFRGTPVPRSAPTQVLAGLASAFSQQQTAPAGGLASVFGQQPSQSAGLVGRGLAAAVRKFEDWTFETLGDDGETSAENNSSALILLNPEPGHHVLLTGDAGVPALTAAADRLDAERFDYNSIRFLQVPHHGSRRNLGPTILNRLVGPRLLSDQKLRTGFVSASKDAPKHPSRQVTNALRRRGVHVYETAGRPIWHHHDAPGRDNYTSIDPVDFQYEIED